MPILIALLVAAATVAYWYWLHAPAPVEPSLGATLLERRIVHQGRERRFAFFRPPRAADGAPLVIVLHASGGSVAAIRRQTGYGFERLAATHGFVVAYPVGIGGYWNDCRRAGRSRTKRLGVDDVGFVRALVASLRASGGGGSVFAAGFSNGGHMCFRLALDAPDLVAAIAVYGANLPTDDNSVCAARCRFVPAIVVNGTNDPINPYDGGHVSIFGWNDRGTVHASADTLTRLAAPLASARREQREVVVAGDGGATSVDRERVIGDDGMVALYTVHGGGHVVPQPWYRSARIVGRTEMRFDAIAASWELFAERLRGLS